MTDRLHFDVPATSVDASDDGVRRVSGKLQGFAKKDPGVAEAHGKVETEQNGQVPNRRIGAPDNAGTARLQRGTFEEYVIALAVIVVVTAAGFAFTPMVGPHATALTYLLAVVFLALFVGRGPTLAAAATSALLWDYFFLAPVFAFRIDHIEDAMLFGTYFVVALVLGHLTTRIRLQQEAESKAKLLAESERLSKTLLDCMSHEMRTPIAAIAGATSNLAEAAENDPKTRREMVGEILEATRRLNRLVGNMIEASRLESGAVKPRISECDVRELIYMVVEGTEKELKSHRLTLAIDRALPLVNLDFVLMQQVLTNLLLNSALHNPPGTSIELSARMEKGELTLSVADRGPGIPQDHLPRIFDKFYRIPGSRTGGTGLGLSLVKGFVEAQGGRVTAKNRSGGGVVFMVHFSQSAGMSTTGA